MTTRLDILQDALHTWRTLDNFSALEDVEYAQQRIQELEQEITTFLYDLEQYGELLEMADMYGSTCTGQEEKYQDWIAKGFTWRWVDCIAAFDLIRGLPHWWDLVEVWRKEHKCRICGFPKTHHAYSCSVIRRSLGGAY